MRGHIAGVVLLALGTVLRSAPALSQGTSKEPSAKRIASELRTRGIAPGAVQLLTQAKSAQPRMRLDSIADSLVAIATTYSGDSARAVRIRAEAIDIIGLAGKGPSGIPYDGAMQRLFQISQSEYSGAAAALVWMLSLPNRSAALQTLRAAAISQSHTATVAVGLLGRQAGQDGVEILRQLYVRRLVKEPRASKELEGLASFYRWPSG